MTIIPVPGTPGGSTSSNLRAGPDLLRLAAAAYLGRFTGLSRQHSTSDLTVFLTWCAGLGLDPLVAGRADLERYVRWLQETPRFKPSTVSRRVSVIAGFHRTCVIDGLLDHSPAEHLRRSRVPPESPTLGLTHQIAARHADPGPRCATTGPARTSTATPTTSSPPICRPAPAL